MEIVFIIFFALIGFGLLVFIHEFGHFITGKFFKVGIEVFSFGWGKEWFGFDYKGTHYQVSMIPIGGFCKFAGEHPDGTLTEKERRKPGTFYGISPFKRLLIVLSGPFFNYFLAIIILTCFNFFRQELETLPTTVVLIDEISPEQYPQESPAKKGGMLTGDKIISVSGKKINEWNDLSKIVALNPKKPMVFEVERYGEIKTLTVTPEWDKEAMRAMIGISTYIPAKIKNVTKGSLAEKLGLKANDQIISLDKNKDINNYAMIDSYLSKTQDQARIFITLERNGEQVTLNSTFHKSLINDNVGYGIEYYLPLRIIKGQWLIPAFAKGFIQANQRVADIFQSLRLLVTQKMQWDKAVAGPIRGGYYLGKYAVTGFTRGISTGFSAFFNFVALISLLLFVGNLLPIPALDGGHVIISIGEIIMKKPIKLELLGKINAIGFAILFTLIIVVTFWDILFLIKL